MTTPTTEQPTLPPMPQERPLTPWMCAAALLLLLVLTTMSYGGQLTHWPHSKDAFDWIAKGDPAAESWYQWTFQTRHFKVTYRPVTALSFTANNLLSMQDTTFHRCTDLLLHLGVGVLTFILARRLVPLANPWLALIPVAFVLLHPVVDQILPHLARRSYPLGMFLGLAGLVCVPGATGSATWRLVRLVAAGFLFALALLANEAVVLCVAIAPLLLWAERPAKLSPLALLVPGVIVALPTALALILRAQVVAEEGGYTITDPASPLQVLQATFMLVLGMSPEWFARREETAFGAGLIVLLLVLLGLCIHKLRIGKQAAAGIWIPLLWLLGYAALFAPLGVWFPRQTYPLLVPLGLLLFGIVAAGRFSRVGLACAGVLLGWAVFQGPLVQDRHALHVAREANLRMLHQVASGLSKDATLAVAMPVYRVEPTYESYRARSEPRDVLGSRQALRWVAYLLDRPARQLQPLLLWEQDPQGSPAVQLQEQPPQLVIAPDTDVLFQEGKARMESSPGETLEIRRRSVAPARAIFFFDGSRAVELPVASLTTP